MSSRSQSPGPSAPFGEDHISPDDEYTPAPWIAWLRRHIWKVGVIFGLVFVTTMHFLLQRRPEPPPVLSELGEFSLVDQEGRPFGPEQMRGKTWVVGFIFTRCGSVCPAVSQAMLHFQSEYIAASRMQDEVHMLTVTVDPAYDKPEVLAAYANELGADLDHWTFVTGSPEAIEDFVVGRFMLAMGEREEVEPGVFDIAHATKLAAVDRFGKVRHYAGTDPEALNELYHRLFTIMRAEADTP